MSEHSAEKDASLPVAERRDAKCRCFQFPHDRGDRSARCRYSLTVDEEAVFAVVRRFTADTKEKRDWPHIADEQAVRIVLGLSSADHVTDWLTDVVAQAKAEERERIATLLDTTIPVTHDGYASVEELIAAIRAAGEDAAR